MAEPFETPAGSRLHVASEGDGPLVVAIHGLGGGAYFFGGCGRRVSACCRFVTLDLPGTGGSTSAVPATAGAWAGEIAALVAGLGGPAVIVGHSLGTILALEVWRRRPELVRAMIFVGGLPAVRPVIRERLMARAAAIRSGGIRGWGARVVPGVFGAQAIETLPEIVALFARAFDDQVQDAYLATLELLLAADAGDVVSTITVPCASISGSEDQYAPPEAVAAFVSQLPRGTPNIVFPHVGHVPFFEDPEGFSRAVMTFLGGLLQGSIADPSIRGA